MADFSTILSLLQLAVGATIILTLILRDRGRRREQEEAERRAYKTGVWMNEL